VTSGSDLLVVRGGGSPPRSHAVAITPFPEYNPVDDGYCDAVMAGLGVRGVDAEDKDSLILTRSVAWIG
jgi:hypothetical protein